jgi:hypothetical protein
MSISSSKEGSSPRGDEPSLLENSTYPSIHTYIHKTFGLIFLLAHLSKENFDTYYFMYQFFIRIPVWLFLALRLSLFSSS